MLDDHAHRLATFFLKQSRKNCMPFLFTCSSGSNKKSNENESSVYHFVGATVAVGKSCKGS